MNVDENANHERVPVLSLCYVDYKNKVCILFLKVFRNI